jgi:hypothetical protein
VDVTGVEHYAYDFPGGIRLISCAMCHLAMSNLTFVEVVAARAQHVMSAGNNRQVTSQSIPIRRRYRLENGPAQQIADFVQP